ncbi:unnamed protein product, partial [Tetraodon nigroviridis]
KQQEERGWEEIDQLWEELSSCTFPRLKIGRGAEASGSGSKDCGRIEVCPPNIHTCFPPFPFFRPYILTFCC